MKNNFVAKHAREFNRATVENDKKKKMKNLTDRKRKHKVSYSE